MHIHEIQSFGGRNIYSHRPVVRMTVDIGDLYREPTKEINGFNESLVNLFPGLRKHYCSLGYEGGFIDRLKEGTYIGHVTEHLILELQSIMGYEVCFGKTRVIREPSLYYIIVEYINERCCIECCRSAVGIISKLAAGKEIEIENILKDLRKITIETELGPSAKSIYNEAVKRGIPVSRVGCESMLQLGYGKYSRYIEASLSDAPSCISVDMASSKYVTKSILADHKIPVPKGDIAYTEDSAVAIAEEIGYPVVVKPYNANQGKGVAIDIGRSEQVRAAYAEALKYSKMIIVEKYIKGKDYRVLVVGDKVSAVSERRPPSITGDGIHTIKELVEAENRNPLRGDDHEKPLTKIKLDNVAVQVLKRYNLDIESILAPGETLRLRDNGNLSTGGTARNCTGEIHPLNELMAVRAAKALGLDIAGVDITTEDISVPIDSENGCIIEVNAAPGLRMHLYPTDGTSRNVSKDIVEMMFPEGRPVSVPIVSVTGTNGKTTTTRLIGHVLALAGKKVGMTSTSGVFIDGECIMEGDNTGPVSARLVLSNRSVEAAVLETARGGIVRKGLGYDAADVGVITNIGDDHLGIDGINSLEDLAFVKALVIEAVKPEGHAVLNADDQMCNYLIKRAKCNIVLFSKNCSNPVLAEHVEKQKKAVYLENGNIYIHDGKNRRKLIEIDKIPITYKGKLECNIENSLAAVAALYSLKVPDKFIVEGLKTFTMNKGRFNLFDLGNFKVMLDYGHNPGGYREVVKFLKNMDAKRLVGIIGVPGDRQDRNISEVGEICGNSFQKLYIKEDNDLRGREPGEVAQILYNSALKGSIKKEQVKIILPELKALEAAILDAQPGDLITMLYEKYEPAVELIERFINEIEKNIIQPEIAIEETAVVKSF